MLRWTTRSLPSALALCVSVSALPAQSWNDARTRELVARATQRRAMQLADSGLTDYSASARGYLTFLAQLGEGFLLPPKVIKADELALEVYWRAPNHSKQWVVGRRDTLLLPTDIQYHRDHLGIVQNNFPNIIRLGDGDEVQDVPHPLSAPGLAAYDFAITDSLRIAIPGREIDVLEVKVRPRDERSAAAVGALYVSRDDAQVVRMAFSFTRTALKDKQLEDVSVILENSLIEGRFWLPRRQEIEIRRTGTWMEFPARGIIRGRWEIRDYAVNRGDTVATSAGPEIVPAPVLRRARHTWPTEPILDLLPPDVKLATGDDVRRVQEEARELVRQQALTQARGTLPSARGISDIVRVNRVEGLAFGGGIRTRFAGGVSAAATARFGLADHEPKATASLGWRRANGLGVTLRAFADLRSVEDEPEVSRAVSSLAAQEFGSDFTEPMAVRGIAVTLGFAKPNGPAWSLEVGYEKQDSVSVHAAPSFGHFAPTLPVEPLEGPRATLSVAQQRILAGGGFLKYHGEARAARTPATSSASGHLLARAYAMAELASAHPKQLSLRIAGGLVESGGHIPIQELFLLGGPTSAPGYGYHELRAGGFGSFRIEQEFRIPFPVLPLGRFGRSPGAAGLSPYVGSAYLFDSRSEFSGWHSFAGVGLSVLFDLVRIDVGRGLRDGRWRITADLARDFWPIL